MGQQQLFLLILVTIIIGVAIVMGINIAAEDSLSANQEQVRVALTTIAARAQGWYRRPAQLGGGGRTFIAISLDTINFKGHSVGKFVLSNKTAGSFRITGFSREDSTWSQSFMVFPDSMAIAP